MGGMLVVWKGVCCDGFLKRIGTGFLGSNWICAQDSTWTSPGGNLRCTQARWCEVFFGWKFSNRPFLSDLDRD